jgi:DSBA-like thioredoxin domain
VRPRRHLELVIYGDFNCPFSALASDRAARLEATGHATIDWRAVEHDRSIPSRGSPVDAVRRIEFEREIAVVRDQLRPAESIVLEPPTVFINTATLNRSYAAVAPQDLSHVRQRLFHTYWRGGADMDDAATIAGLPGPAEGARIADRWQAEWAALDRPIVPAMVLPDGHMSRGLGVLARLADHLEE